MSDESAIIERRWRDNQPYAVVVQAADVIHIAAELLHEARRPDRERMPGELEYHVVQDPDDYGDLISFGTPGEGLGRLTYRLIGRDEAGRYLVAERVAVSDGE